MDALDSVKKWHVADVLKFSTADGEPIIFIHYDGFRDRWNEWIPLNANRLVPLGTHT